MITIRSLSLSTLLVFCTTLLFAQLPNNSGTTHKSGIHTTGKVAVCHNPPGQRKHNPTAVRSRTLWVDSTSLADHLGHGDSIGVCPVDSNGGGNNGGGNGGGGNNGGGGGNGNKVLICHNPDSQMNSIWVAAPAVAAHLAHGDSLGTCDTTNKRGFLFEEAEIIQSNGTALKLYPNPFAGSTAFSFQVQTDGDVSLEIFDIMGKRVAVVYNGFVKAGLTYTVNFDANKLSNGIYLSRLTTQSGNSINEKMILNN
ncbi:MAG: T9SS type A sorting domain-containing protein [Bacteroidetes bacterium]|nr:T9SS type A sorting domain-containing protein [Bacteroidota bacterium]